MKSVCKFFILFLFCFVLTDRLSAQEQGNEIVYLSFEDLPDTKPGASTKYEQPVSSALDNRDNGGGDFSLEDLLNIKISTAAKYEQTASEAPASVTIITSDDIERYGYQTIEDVFKTVRGFYISNDRNYSYLGVRGFSRPTDYNNRLLLLLNGHAMNENFYSGDAALVGSELALDPDALERIEIIRGPGAVLYGTNAMFAVVNIVTKRGNTVDGLQVSTAAGSYGRIQGAAMYGKEFDNGIDLFISGGAADIDGQDLFYAEYNDPLNALSANNGIAENLDRDQSYNALVTMSYKKIDLQARFASHETGIPTGAFKIDFNDDAARTRDERGHFEIKYDDAISNDKNIMLRGYFDHYGYNGTYPFQNQPDLLDFFETNAGKWLGSEMKFCWDPRPNNRLIVGVEYQKHLRANFRQSEGAEKFYDENFPYKTFSSYLQNEFQATKKLALTLGVRWDNYSTFGNSITPRAAIVYHPMNSTSLKLLYGEAFRAPSIFEFRVDDGVFFSSNSDLEPEKIKTLEIILEQQLNRNLTGLVSIYDYSVKNLIDPFEVDSVTKIQQFRNISKAEAFGLELELNMRLKNGLQGYMNYSFQDTQNSETKKDLTNSPEHIAKAGLSLPALKYFRAAAELQYETGRITVETEDKKETKTDSYLLANIQLSTRSGLKEHTALAGLLNHATISLLVNNLFNETYQTPGGVEHLQAGITQNGRNFQVKLRYKL